MKAQLQQKVQFQPVDLDKESDEFVAQLDFFRGPFVFVYEQLFVFLKTIAEKLNPEDNESEGDQVENDELADDT